MTTPITASMLYDLETCPHRVSMDLYADPADRDEVNPFVQQRRTDDAGTGGACGNWSA